MTTAFQDKQAAQKKGDQQTLLRRCRELADKGHAVDAINEYRAAAREKILTKQNGMNFKDALAALRPLATQHKTAQGERSGFSMRDAARALGGLEYASNALSVLLVEGLVESEPVVIDGDVHTLYRLAEVAAPTLH